MSSLCIQINQLANFVDYPITPTFMSELTSRMQRWYIHQSGDINTTIRSCYSDALYIPTEEAWVTEYVLFQPLQHTRPNLFGFIRHMFFFPNAEFCPTAATFGLVDVLRYAHKQLQCVCNEDTIIAAITSTDVGGIDCFRYAHEEAHSIWNIDTCIKVAMDNATSNPNSNNCLAYIQNIVTDINKLAVN